MRRSKPLWLVIPWLSGCFPAPSYAMGLKTFVALPVEKGGAVGRFSLNSNEDSDTFVSSGAYGLDAKKALLFSLPYRLSSSGGQRVGDISALYRQITYQKDRASGTDRLGLLVGAVIPTQSQRDSAVQTGFVFTHYKHRNEIDIDALYQMGLGSRFDSGRYDISWQYRLLPKERPDWGIVKELNSVIELNGRWQENNEITHQITVGLQQTYKKWVVEGGVTKDINNDNKLSYIVSTRFHF